MTLSQVYSALAYAEDHSEEIDEDFAEHARGFEEGLLIREEYLAKLEEEHSRR